MANQRSNNTQHNPHMAMNYEYPIPQFTDPFSSTSITSNNLYHANAPNVAAQQQQQQQLPLRSNSLNSANYASSAASIPPQAMRQEGRGVYETTYGVHNNAFAPPRYSVGEYQARATYPTYEQDVQRRASYPVKPPLMGRESYNDALDASQGMVALSQDMTPRNVYAPRNGSQDSYGFPTHSTNSSISSASGYSHYYHPGSYTGSIDGSIAGSSITDYSSETEHAMAARTMPGTILHAHYPQQQSSMMTQFNSKTSTSAQKKHQCKVCQKRFTRPSSLQTHMFSHTGEKPFGCDWPSCGRHFSVVSNLRRHKKCHRTLGDPSSPSDEDDSHLGPDS